MKKRRRQGKQTEAEMDDGRNPLLKRQSTNGSNKQRCIITLPSRKFSKTYDGECTYHIGVNNSEIHKG